MTMQIPEWCEKGIGYTLGTEGALEFKVLYPFEQKLSRNGMPRPAHELRGFTLREVIKKVYANDSLEDTMIQRFRSAYSQYAQMQLAHELGLLSATEMLQFIIRLEGLDTFFSPTTKERPTEDELADPRHVSNHFRGPLASAIRIRRGRSDSGHPMLSQYSDLPTPQGKITESFPTEELIVGKSSNAGIIKGMGKILRDMAIELGQAKAAEIKKAWPGQPDDLRNLATGCYNARINGQYSLADIVREVYKFPPGAVDIFEMERRFIDAITIMTQNIMNNSPLPGTRFGNLINDLSKDWAYARTNHHISKPLDNSWLAAVEREVLKDTEGYVKGLRGQRNRVAQSFESLFDGEIRDKLFGPDSKFKEPAAIVLAMETKLQQRPEVRERLI